MLKHLSLCFASSAAHTFPSIVFLSFLIFSGPARAQGPAALVYLPQVINYSVNEYKAGNQNWAVTQDKSGLLYFGNNRGLLQFDGIRWTLYPLPNRVPVRSVYAAPDGRLYVGSFEEFGYFERDLCHRLVYHSLKEKVKDYRFFNDEIWTIRSSGGRIYFQSFSSFFVYDGENVRLGRSPYAPLYFFTIQDTLYAQFIGAGLYRAEGETFTPLIGREELQGDDVVGVLPYDDKLLLVTAVNGLYLYDRGCATAWDVPASGLLKNSTANRAVMLPDSCYIVGTISDGLLAIDKKGTLLWHINRENHLINNTVLGLSSDRCGNLWVALDNGLAQIEVNSPLYFYEPPGARIGMVHDMAMEKESIYLATNQGVYLLSDKRPPRLIPGTSEQTWYLAREGHQLIAGHNKGTLLIEGETARPITGPNGGGTALRKCLLHGKEVLVQASYNALSIFIRGSAGTWAFSHNVEGFNNLIKSFEVDPAGNIWASHMFKGIYRLRLDETLRQVKEEEYIGFLDDTQQESTIHVMKLRGRIVLTDGRKFYTYEDLSRRIVPYEGLNRDYPWLSDTYRIVPLNNDLYWFIRNTEYVLLAYEGGRFVVRQRIPFTLFDNPTIENRGNIYVGNEGTSYFCLSGGIARYTPRWEQPDTVSVPLSLASLTAYNRHDGISVSLPCASTGMPDETGAGSSGFFSVRDNRLSVDYTYNTLSFGFLYPEYSGRRYRIFYKLEGFEPEWVEGGSDFVRMYSNLPSGSFILHAQVEDDTGRQVACLAYPFEVKRPFYRSAPAFALYIILLITLLVMLARGYVAWEMAREKRAAEAEKKRQEEQLRAQEQLIVKLKNERLETELTYKSKELASATLAVITHNDFLEGLKKEILAQQLSGSYTKRFFDKLLRMLDENRTAEDEWAVFQSNFDRIHERFFRKLKEQYPELTPGDLRLCALLRLNMPTKDVARMQNLTVRGVEAARYRLRKKLNLPEGQSLVDFMIQFH